jgi:hypothetical protein
MSGSALDVSSSGSASATEGEHEGHATPEERSQLCTVCFTGEYPLPVPGEHEQLAQIRFDFDEVHPAP